MSNEQIMDEVKKLALDGYRQGGINAMKSTIEAFDEIKSQLGPVVSVETVSGLLNTALKEFEGLKVSNP